jgi:FAD/FMN-containing dehydrogenase
VHPADRDQVIAAVRAAAGEGLPVKAVGSGHSFTSAATTSGVRLELDRLSGLISVDVAARLATFPRWYPAGGRQRDPCRSRARAAQSG